MYRLVSILFCVCVCVYTVYMSAQLAGPVAILRTRDTRGVLPFMSPRYSAVRGKHSSLLFYCPVSIHDTLHK